MGNTETVTLALMTLMLVNFIGHVRCHGRLWEPPSRSSMWRRGYNTAVNINDNELSCGGFENQWVKYRGLCGVCGDPYQQQPRENEAGGKYASGLITRIYQTESIIDVTVDLTANHGGHFEFQICQRNDPRVLETPSCFSQHKLTVLGPHGEKNRYILIDRDIYGHIGVKVKLPPGLTCRHCVLQWKYVTASRWNCKGVVLCKKGLGPQEEFYGCSDIAIYDSDTFQSNDFSVIDPSEYSQPSRAARATKQLEVVPSHGRSKDEQEKRVALALKSKFNPFKKLPSRLQKAHESSTVLDIESPTDVVTSYFQKLVLDATFSYFKRHGVNFTITPLNCTAANEYSETPGFDNWCTLVCKSGFETCPLRKCYCNFIITPEKDPVQATEKDAIQPNTDSPLTAEKVATTSSKQRSGIDDLPSFKSESDTRFDVTKQSKPTAVRGNDFKPDTKLLTNRRISVKETKIVKPNTKWLNKMIPTASKSETVKPTLSGFIDRPPVPDGSIKKDPSENRETLHATADKHASSENNIHTTHAQRDDNHVTENELGVKRIAPKKLVCVASKAFSKTDSVTEWCMQNCTFGFCPKNVCTCKSD